MAPYTIVGGNPAKPLKQRFPDEAVAKLLDIQWWNWEADKITRNLEAIVSADLGALQRAS